MVESILGAVNIEAAKQMVAAQFSERSLPEPILEALAMKKLGVSQKEDSWIGGAIKEAPGRIWRSTLPGMVHSFFRD